MPVQDALTNFVPGRLAGEEFRNHSGRLIQSLPASAVINFGRFLTLVDGGTVNEIADASHNVVGVAIRSQKVRSTNRTSYIEGDIVGVGRTGYFVVETVSGNTAVDALTDSVRVSVASGDEGKITTATSGTINVSGKVEVVEILDDSLVGVLVTGL